MIKLLVHCCCAHCAAYTLKYWQNQGYDVSAYWCNANIHPYTEHQKRLKSMRQFMLEEGFEFIEENEYPIDAYLKATVGNSSTSERCYSCYLFRMKRTALFAAANGFQAFSSSLTISPQQNHKSIIAAGNESEALSGVRFLYDDLRKMYSESRKITKPLDLYRQQYCGCLFSEYERYRNSDVI